VANTAWTLLCPHCLLNLCRQSHAKVITVYVAQTLLSWSRVVSETCRTRVSYVFLRICHMSTCRVYFNTVVSLQHRLPFSCQLHRQSTAVRESKENRTKTRLKKWSELKIWR